MRRLIFDSEQIDVEDKRRVRRNDATGPACAVAKSGRDDERALAADLHGRDAFVPAGDDLMGADLELERLVAIDRAIEFLAFDPIFIKPAGVIYHAGLAWPRRG